MNKTLEKIMLVILGITLVVGLIVTSQVRWTTDPDEAIPLEEVARRGESDEQGQSDNDVNQD